MRRRVAAVLLIGIWLGGCADRDGAESAARMRAGADAGVEDAFADRGQHGPGQAETYSQPPEALAAERERTRAGLRLELSRRLRDRAQYHLLVAQGIGSTEILASMDAAIARTQARIEALAHPATDAETHTQATGCAPDRSAAPAHNAGSRERLDRSPAGGRGCVGVVALCLPPHRCL